MTAITPDPVLTAAAVARLVTTWNSASTAEEVAPVLTCDETDVLAAVFLAAGDEESAKAWISEHVATESECRGHDENTTPAPAPYAPGPGEAYTYPLCDYAFATARSLGAGWEADSCHLGAWGLILSTDGRVALRLYVDGTGDTGDLMLQDRHTRTEYVVPGDCTPTGGAASNPDEMREWGNALALFVLSLGL